MHDKLVIHSAYTALEILQAIDEWSRGASDTDNRALWDVLTALRGPDDNDAQSKSQTTQIIRAVVPHLAAANGAFYNMYPSTQEHFDALYEGLRFVEGSKVHHLRVPDHKGLPWHFSVHVKKAMTVLRTMLQEQGM